MFKTIRENHSKLIMFILTFSFMSLGAKVLATAEDARIAQAENLSFEAISTLFSKSQNLTLSLKNRMDLQSIVHNGNTMRIGSNLSCTFYRLANDVTTELSGQEFTSMFNSDITLDRQSAISFGTEKIDGQRREKGYTFVFANKKNNIHMKCSLQRQALATELIGDFRGGDSIEVKSDACLRRGGRVDSANIIGVPQFKKCSYTPLDQNKVIKVFGNYGIDLKFIKNPNDKSSAPNDVKAELENNGVA